MADYPTLFKDFLALQGSIVKPAEPKAATVIKPRMRRMEDDSLTFDTIVTKRPKKGKVLKYLQCMIDDILKENEDS